MNMTWVQLTHCPEFLCADRAADCWDQLLLPRSDAEGSFFGFRVGMKSASPYSAQSQCDCLARCSWLPKLQGIQISLVLADSRRRLDIDTLQPWSFDFPPESCASRISSDAKYLGNFPPIKSSATRARHNSTLIRKIAASLRQTPVGELRTTHFLRIAPKLWGEQTGRTKTGRSDEGNGRHTGVYVFSIETCGRGWLA